MKECQKNKKQNLMKTRKCNLFFYTTRYMLSIFFSCKEVSIEDSDRPELKKIKWKNATQCHSENLEHSHIVWEVPVFISSLAQ